MKRKSSVATDDELAARRTSSRLKATHENVDNKNQTSEICFDDNETNIIPLPRRTSARLKDHQARGLTSEARSDVPEKQQTKRRRSSEKSPLRPTKKSKIIHSKETMALASKEADERLRNIKQINDENLYNVHPDFRLQRNSYDGKNFTYGVAKHDLRFVNDASKATPYVTDIFQHLFNAEVSDDRELFFVVYKGCESYQSNLTNRYLFDCRKFRGQNRTCSNKMT